MPSTRTRLPLGLVLRPLRPLGPLGLYCWLGLCSGLVGHVAGGAVGDVAGQKGCLYGGRLHAVGERWATGPPDKCAKYLCQDDDQFVALTCPWFVPAPGCTPIPGDEHAVYPGCCPTRKCHTPMDPPEQGDDEAATPSTSGPDSGPTTTTRRTMSWRPGALRGGAAVTEGETTTTTYDQDMDLSGEEDAVEAVEAVTTAV